MQISQLLNTNPVPSQLTEAIESPNLQKRAEEGSFIRMSLSRLLNPQKITLRTAEWIKEVNSTLKCDTP